MSDQRRTSDLSWVRQIETVDAIDITAVEALNDNDGWQLLGVGVGAGGQTTLTYGWPAPSSCRCGYLHDEQCEAATEQPLEASDG